MLGRDKYSAGMQHNVRDAQKSLCDASKGAREPDAESGCVMWPSRSMRRWRFIFYLEDCRRLRDRVTWFGQVCFRAFAADHGSRKTCIREGPAASSWLLSSATLCGWTGHVTQGMISSVLTVWKEGRSRKGIMDGLRKFIAVDNHEAVVGWLAPRHRVFPGGAANVYSRFLIRSHPRRSGRGYTAGA